MAIDRSPWNEGFRARLAGKDTDANPHNKLTEAWFEWADGWKDQDEHLRDRDEALASIGWFGPQ